MDKPETIVVCMKLYICFSTNGSDHHACAKAFRALTEAGHKPELVKVYGQGSLPKFLQTKGRKEIKKRTGNYHTPMLVLDDGSVVNPSDKIVEWATKNKTKV
jgi:hypothetical protein